MYKKGTYLNIAPSERAIETPSIQELLNSEFMPNLFTIDANIWTEYGVENTGTNSQKLFIEKCTFKDNKVHTFANDVSRLNLKKNKFSGNTFENPE